MNDNDKKCSIEEHKEINAIKYCPECKIYLCNKCDNMHSTLLKNHHPYNINNNLEIFTNICKEKNHINELKYFCKNHNQLCCAACLCKLNEIGDGQHMDCDVCTIEKIKEEKKNKLKENIKCLEDLQNKINETMKGFKEIIQKIEKEKDDLKLEIQNVFTQIRNILNKREDELLLEVDKLYNDKYFNEDIIKKGEKLPKQIKLSLEKGKSIDKEWDNNNLYSYINDCINIENNIKTINLINESIIKYNSKNKAIFIFSPKDNQLEKFMEIIQSFGKIIENKKYSFKECPLNIKEERKFIITGEDKNIFTKLGSDAYYGGTICENELDKSIEEHKWRIKILKSKNKYIYIGVATIDFDFNKTNYNTCGWYLYLYNSPPTLYSGAPFNYNGVKTNLREVNDEVIVIMNMKRRTLKFIINNYDRGDSYINIPLDKPLFPAISLMNKNDSVEITPL